jgi:3-oxoacyl-[acyl-carrier protein] reductase
MNAPSANAVVVTGATKGLGLAISKMLVDRGFKLIGVARQESAEFTNLRNAHPEAVFFEPADLAILDQIHSFAAGLLQRYGRIYALINNAAIGNDGVLSTMHETDIEKLLRINLHAPILLTKYLTRGMLINRKGRVVNISSIIASTGFSGLAVYAATKAGLIGFSKSLSRELGKVGITVNCVAPGYMETEMTGGLNDSKMDSIRRRSPMSRFATTQEVATAVGYLLADESSAVTGTVITVDAGSTA